MRYWKKASGGGGITPQMFGCTKYEVGEFIPTSNMIEITINHSLGLTPKAVLVTNSEMTKTKNYVNMLSAMYNKDSTAYIITANGTTEMYYIYSAGITFRNTYVTCSLQTTYKFKANSTYKYIILY